MLKIKYNYHTHTYRCGHAKGKDEEYVQYALAAHLKELGFSDHIYYPGLPQKPIRQSEEEFQDYIDSIYALKEKYKKQIKIYVGYEAEYFPEFDYHYKKLLKEGKIQYLLLGQHCFHDENGYHWFNENRNDKEQTLHYVNTLIQGMETGYFSYVAHPDLFMNSYTERDEFLLEQIHRICNKAKELNMPLEINLEGCRKKIQPDRKFIDEDLDQPYYPHPLFWMIAKETKCKIIIGIDAHRPEDLYNPYLEMVQRLVNLYKIKPITKIKIKTKFK